MTGDESGPVGETSRRIFLRRGLLVGAGAAAVGIASTVQAGRAVAASAGTALAVPSGQQFEWSWCSNCQGLYYGPWDGNCPDGGSHYGYRQGSLNYCLFYGTAGTGGYQSQPNWQVCSACAGLFYGPNGRVSYCPSGGAHYAGSSYNYKMLYNVPGKSGIQAGWSWCRNCQGLFYGPNQQESRCPYPPPAYAAPHDGRGSYNYAML